MYLAAQTVVSAIRSLKAQTHPFVGITFLACKEHGLKVGGTEQLSLDTLTRNHLGRHHVLDRHSSYYFQPFKSQAYWVVPRYPSTGLQTVNTQTFNDVFIHPRGTSKWGFVKDYVDKVKSKLREINFADRIGIDALAVWIYKGRDVGDLADIDDIVALFANEFQITEEERRELFSERWLTPSLLLPGFSEDPLIVTDVAKEFPAPPDAELEIAKSLSFMRLTNVGPASNMSISFGERLTLITGDNGLGKSFLLDFAWWAATGAWPERPILPSMRGDEEATVEYSFRASSGRALAAKREFDPRTFSWGQPEQGHVTEALAVFSRADGSFALFDPLRKRFQGYTTTNILSAYEVWNGKPGVIEGLLRDWPRWQSSPDRIAFDRYAAVLRRLSPEDLGVLSPGQSVRIPGDPRDIPTVQHRYGTVPVTQASSGVQRVLLLAYLIIWSWQEHELAASQLDELPLRRMLVIVDELEAHLHPKWQRIVLPALMSVGGFLSADLAMQMISATHSPMILASVETHFSNETDTLYHLFGEGAEVKLEEVPFVKYGDVSGWLTSPLFGLRHARSREAEQAIEDAKALQQQETPSVTAVVEVSARLKMHLADDDKFWPRWLYFADKHGVEL
ncbi:AAA family ATPase [Bradyrhizobium sp. WSM 1704]|uniref:AAA family ATPase n=1 Tax=Bradyrhizobium semiaridum TaxID=2821404 RepID=UPI001CE36147|nr:AAA family ATPase [Bradyrhizobium semiaridum]MCA6124219.1 AAA family ATPase [Bradyrhizobium semiaridum]